MNRSVKTPKFSSFIPITLVFFFLFVSPAVARSKGFGLGVILFGPTGISANFKKSSNRSIDAALSWDFDDYIYIHSDLLFIKKSFFKIERLPFNLYYGLGGQLKIYDSDRRKSDKTLLGVRAPLGISHNLRGTQIEFFLEGAITLYLIEKTELDIGLGIGARYYF